MDSMIQYERNDVEAITDWHERLEARTLEPVRTTTTGYKVLIAVLFVIAAWGVYAWFFQLRDGLYVTGLRDRISWGMYISTFVFFIGISHAGTLISAILRVSNAGWRAPITRIAEFITVVALVGGASFIILDMGRPDRLLNVFLHGRWQSPIMWDVLAITTYIMSSLIYLYLPMIPDLALFRDKMADVPGKVAALRHRLYSMLAVGWTGTPGQHRALGKSITTMMVLIIPIAVSVHTVVSWIFGMTLRPGWNSSVFGIFFVAGAIFSGVATLVIILVILRKVYHLEEYITEKHFVYLGYFIASFALIMIYFNVTEYLTTGFKLEEGEEFLFRQLFLEEFAWMYWFYLIGGLIVPGLIILWKRTRTVYGIFVAAILVDLAMYIERYFIVVTGLRVPLLSYEPASYSPTWIEWSILASGVAGFALLIALFIKVFPIMAVWEIAEEHEARQLAPGRQAMGSTPATGPEVSP